MIHYLDEKESVKFLAIPCAGYFEHLEAPQVQEMTVQNPLIKSKKLKH